MPAVRLGPYAIAKVLRRRAVLRRHEHWSREHVLREQAHRLETLRRFAQDESPFYREFHAGLSRKSLEDLPILTKQTLMDNWDRVSTNTKLHLESVFEFVTKVRSDPELLYDRFYTAATSGSSGHRGIFAYDPNEWQWVVASYARSNDWAGVAAGLFHHLRLAVVSTTKPWHQSAVVGASLKSALVPTLRLDVTVPLAAIVEQLNNFQPESLVAYAGMAGVLAGEQLEGRLAITPQAVLCASEVLTEEARADISRAFGAEPYETYAATETAGIASDCRHHHLHLFEDLVIPEVVDSDGQVVPPGEVGDRLLVTVLFSRTLPLIRYELTDRVALAANAYPCDLPFRALARVEGRTEDVLSFSGTNDAGVVAVHPNVFHDVLDRADLRRWQVLQLSTNQVQVRVVPRGDLDTETLRRSLVDSLRLAGAAAKIEVMPTTQLEYNAAGKTPLISRTERLGLTSSISKRATSRSSGQTGSDDL